MVTVKYQIVETYVEKVNEKSSSSTVLSSTHWFIFIKKETDETQKILTENMWIVIWNQLEARHIQSSDHLESGQSSGLRLHSGSSQFRNGMEGWGRSGGGGTKVSTVQLDSGQG